MACRLYARFEAPWHLLGWVALVPWLATLQRARSTRDALLAGLAGAVAFELLVFGWFGGAIDAYAGTPSGVGLAVLALFAPWLQPQLVAAALAWEAARRRRLGAVRTSVVLTGAWVAAEWLVPKLFGDSMGYGLWPSPWMRQGADLVGVPGLTAVLVLANLALLAAVHAAAGAGTWPSWPGVAASAAAAASWRSRLRGAAPPATAAVLLAATLAGYGAWRLDEIAAAGGTELVRAAVVQASVRRYDALRAQLGAWAVVRRILDAYESLSLDALARGPVALLVWPETVYPTTFGTPKSADGEAFDREIAAFVARTGVPLVFGTYDVEDGAEFNAAAFLEPAVHGRASFDAYRKASLFPLTERVPAWLDSPRLRAWLPWLGTWTAGTPPRAVPLRLPDGRTVRVAPLICYDALEPAHVAAAVRDGADLIVTLSNDSWFDDGPGPRLHLVGAAFRSIETRRPQVRSTNTGISAVIDAGGGLVTSAPVDARVALVAGVPNGPGGLTPAVRLGSWVPPLALLAVLLAVALPTRRGAESAAASHGGRPRRRRDAA